MDFASLKAYVITIDPARLAARFKSHVAPTNLEVFAGVRQAATGCTISHFALWDHIRRAHRPDEYILVFEDDAYQHRRLVPSDLHAIDSFCSHLQGDILLLGFNPTIHTYRDVQGRLKQGRGLDSHAYLIRVAYADRLHTRYHSKSSSVAHNLWAPLGAVDTLFLFQDCHLLVPMLYVQSGRGDYRKVAQAGGHPVHGSPTLMWGLAAINRIHFLNPFLLPALVVLVLLLSPAALLWFFTLIALVALIALVPPPLPGAGASILREDGRKR